MRIKMERSLAGPDVSYVRGQEYDVDDALGEALVADGRASVPDASAGDAEAERDDALARLAEIEAERDDALARVAELEKAAEAKPGRKQGKRGGQEAEGTSPAPAGDVETRG